MNENNNATNTLNTNATAISHNNNNTYNVSNTTANSDTTAKNATTIPNIIATSKYDIPNYNRDGDIANDDTTNNIGNAKVDIETRNDDNDNNNTIYDSSNTDLTTTKTSSYVSLSPALSPINNLTIDCCSLQSGTVCQQQVLRKGFSLPYGHRHTQMTFIFYLYLLNHTYNFFKTVLLS